jgi:hypothetical protein
MKQYNRLLNENPCWGCEVRTEECHGKCGQYAAWKKEVDEAREEQLKRKQEEYELDHYTICAKCRCKREIRR